MVAMAWALAEFLSSAEIKRAIIASCSRGESVSSLRQRARESLLGSGVTGALTGNQSARLGMWSAATPKTWSRP